MAAVTTTPLFRKGNATSARLDNLRNEDVEIYTEPAQAEICVHAANTTGVSCYGSSAALAGFRGKTWQLPSFRRLSSRALVALPLRNNGVVVTAAMVVSRTAPIGEPKTLSFISHM